MKNNILTNLLLLIIIVLLIFNLIPKNSSNRYSMYVQSNQIIKLDKETGRMWEILCGDLSKSRFEYELGGYIVKFPPDSTLWQGIVKKR